MRLRLTPRSSHNMRDTETAVVDLTRRNNPALSTNGRAAALQESQQQQQAEEVPLLGHHPGAEESTTNSNEQVARKNKHFRFGRNGLVLKNIKHHADMDSMIRNAEAVAGTSFVQGVPAYWDKTRKLNFEDILRSNHILVRPETFNEETLTGSAERFFYDEVLLRRVHTRMEWELGEERPPVSDRPAQVGVPMCVLDIVDESGQPRLRHTKNDVRMYHLPAQQLPPSVSAPEVVGEEDSSKMSKITTVTGIEYETRVQEISVTEYLTGAEHNLRDRILKRWLGLSGKKESIGGNGNAGKHILTEQKNIKFSKKYLINIFQSPLY